LPLQDFRFPKNHRICSKNDIDYLFKNGKAFLFFPFKVIISEYTAEIPVKILISVPKSRHNKAVARNRIKRMTREAYRKNSSVLYSQTVEGEKCVLVGLIYVNDEIAAYDTIEKAIKKTIKIIEELYFSENS